MFFKSSKVSEIRRVLGWVSGGIYKRIDENRELLELLQREAPDFIRTHSYVQNWLQSQDDFLVRLEEAVPLSDDRFMDLVRTRRPGSPEFPRRWPGIGQ